MDVDGSGPLDVDAPGSPASGRLRHPPGVLATRPRRIALIALAVVLFVAISGLLAGFLSVEGVERDDLLALLRAQARGDVPGMLAQLDHSCRANRGCVGSVRANAARLRRPGAVKILTLTSPTAYALTGASGESRVAWTVIGRLPVVQCVMVKRTGNPLSGVSVALLAVSAPINNEADC
jgi:hypothetical protein